jgi:hypothetical protein
MSQRTPIRLRKALPATCAAFVLAAAGWTPPASGAASTPTLGSPNTVTAEPGVQRPPTTPCTVVLFSGLQFADFNPKSFDYAPPVACPGPWAKVVLEVDLAIDAGRQFDRTAQIALGHVNIYYGTTAEPHHGFGPSWHVERDLTAYSALFALPQMGEVNLGNLVNSTYTSVLTGSATLQLYPSSAAAPAPRTADVVVPLSHDPGGATQLKSGADTLAPALTLPTNVEAAFLDVIAQSQSGDEFWYTCVPDKAAKPLQSCGGTAFRETEITVDGKPAGVAPVAPWIYTGGIDPFLWTPLPGVQTLDFLPFRVDLTPFAGILSDGQPHQVGVTVFNANNYFLVSGSLLLFLDGGSTQVTGAVTRNTLAAPPAPFIKTTLSQAHDGTINASVLTSSSRSFEVAGFVNTSHGKVETTLDQMVQFSNRQKFLVTASAFVQDIGQETLVSIRTRTQAGTRVIREHRNLTYPLTVDIALAFNADGSGSQATSIVQTFDDDDSRIGDGAPFAGSVRDSVTSRDTLLFNSSGSITGTQDQRSSATYFAESTGGICFSRALGSRNGLLTGLDDGEGCPGGVNAP